ncbi:MAG: hypothetical protein WBG46_02080 [Nonlabens sp.]
MMHRILCLFIIWSSFLNAQNQRVQLKGILQSSTNISVGGVTIFNQNTLKGTVSNEEGSFLIEVKKGDVLKIDAVQFKAFQLSVGQGVIDSGEAVITLNEGVNQLDEIVLSDRSLMILVEKEVLMGAFLKGIDPDLLFSSAVNRIENTFSDLERKPEEYAIEQKAASQSGLRMSSVGVDVIGLVSSIFKKRKPEILSPQTDFDISVLKNKYHPEYLTNLLELDPAYINEFIYFAQDNGLSLEMLKSNNELAVIELLLVQVDHFKRKKNLNQ